MDERNIDQRTYGGNLPPLADMIRQGRLRELAAGWVRFLRFLELEQRLDAGEPLVRIVHDDPAG